jgi:2-alkenal reductase
MQLYFHQSGVLKMRRTIRIFIVIFSFVLALGLIGTATGGLSHSVSAQQIGDGINFTQLYQQVSPSVVAIRVTITGRNGRTIGSSTGSGFVIDSEGHIVTNNHVVDDASFIEVEFYDGTLAEGQIVGLDPDSDLAVIEVDVPGDRLFPIAFGDSNTLLVGQPVVAIGSPFGQDWTLTTGIVSGLNRMLDGLTAYSIGGVIQTDAAINPGNSGGPLLNLSGQLIGVNSQIATESGSSSGVGFAIPSNLVWRVAQELIQNGTVDYSYIGISGTDVTLPIIRALNLPENTRGIVVSEVVFGGPAAQAGLRNSAISNTTRRTDVITAINGIQIKGMDELVSYLAGQTLPGQTVTLSVLRDGTQAISLPVVLMSRP